MLPGILADWRNPGHPLFYSSFIAFIKFEPKNGCPSILPLDYPFEYVGSEKAADWDDSLTGPPGKFIDSI
jgi:hypothetical protein